MAKSKAERDDEMNPRSCIVTRQKAERDQLIRFVASPDGKVVADLKDNLPGRGVWTLAKKQIVERAVQKQLFASGLKQPVKADEDLAELTGKLIEERALRSLAMAKKAGSIVTGFAKVDSAVRSGKVHLLLHARDAASDGKRKLANATAFVDHMGGDKVEVFEQWSIDQMSHILGINNAVHVAAVYGGATNNLMAAISQLNAYMENIAEDAGENKKTP